MPLQEADDGILASMIGGGLRRLGAERSSWSATARHWALVPLSGVLVEAVAIKAIRRLLLPA
jgi:hypothetical protein